jgi:glutamate--cysteine ligase
MRALDVCAYNPSGVELPHMCFMEAFLLLCLLAESQPISADELWAIEYNELTIALRGREPGLRLIQGGKRVAVGDWAREIFDAMAPLCEILDNVAGGNAYRVALANQRDAVQDPALLPSTRMLSEMRAAQTSFYEFALTLSNGHAAHFRAQPPAPTVSEQFRTVAEESLVQQRALEADDSVSFEDYLARYFAG